ncbi:hypothetical protein K7432_001856 [Basidiobolus ranarum]|uniref:Alginate lyase domain-containing protein n=1 Tax=Basidiobolus ranarum TaxID=34480 RepID=A0ABR2W9G5_9FUNG
MNRRNQLLTGAGFVIFFTLFYFSEIQLFKIHGCTDGSCVPAVSIDSIMTGEDRAQYVKTLYSEFTLSLDILRKDADSAVNNSQVYSVTLKKQHTPSNDPHDYLSLAKYFWPDPNTATGLPYIRKDGKVNPAIKEVKDFEYLRNMFADVYTLSLAYRFYRNEIYSQKAILRLNEWFVNPETKMNPHIQYGSMIKGELMGRQTGVLDFFHVYRIIDAMEVLRESSHWSVPLENSLNEWFTLYYHWLQQDPLSKGERSALNNHGTFYDCQLMSVALILKNFTAVREIAESSRLNRIEAQIADDGSQPFETERQTSFYYSVFNLRGLFLLSSLSERVGVDIWNYQGKNGRSIKKAVDYILPYALDHGNGWPYHNIGNYDVLEFSSILELAYLRYGDAKYIDGVRIITDRLVKEKGYLPNRRSQMLCNLALVLKNKSWLC